MACRSIVAAGGPWPASPPDAASRRRRASSCLPDAALRTCRCPPGAASPTPPPHGAVARRLGTASCNGVRAAPAISGKRDRSGQRTRRTRPRYESLVASESRARALNGGDVATASSSSPSYSSCAPLKPSPSSPSCPSVRPLGRQQPSSARDSASLTVPSPRQPHRSHHPRAVRRQPRRARSRTASRMLLPGPLLS